jgi:toxin HigB-1
MIRSFADLEAERVLGRLASRHLSVNVQRIAYRKLVIIDAAESINDLGIPPGNRPEKLKGNRQGQYSIRVNDQRRVCFRWRDGDAYEVELTGYHG